MSHKSKGEVINNQDKPKSEIDPKPKKRRLRDVIILAFAGIVASFPSVCARA